MSDLYLFDTNILVHLVRNDPTGQELKSKYSLFLSDPKPFICSVTDGELRSLALQWAWGKHKTGQMGYMLGYFRQVPIERPDLMQTYAAMDFFSNSKGIKMGKNDRVLTTFIGKAPLSCKRRLFNALSLKKLSSQNCTEE